MLSKFLIPGLACIAILSGCATAELAPKVPSFAQAMEEADAVAKAGQADKAVSMYQAAASAYPAEKDAWLKLAQLRYDNGQYGQAIVDAQEVLARDDDDTMAHSIVAVGGLRVASKALADLTLKNNLSGTVRSEAQELAKLLRTSLGEDTLVPKPRPIVKRKDVAGAAAASLPVPPKAAGGNSIFDSLFVPKK